MSSLLTLALCAFFSTLLLSVLLAPVARKVGLVDEPSGRKQHQYPIPLTGGIAVFCSLALCATIWNLSLSETFFNGQREIISTLVGCGGFLVLTGALDDRFHLGVLLRTVSEVLVAIAVIELIGLRLDELGDLVGTGNIEMPRAVAYTFTVIAMFGLINAFNMLDGLDGLLASMVIATVLGFHVFTATAPSLLALCIISALSAFLVSNLDLSPVIPKSFLGDAGSKLLGFIVVVLLLEATSGKVFGSVELRPVTALYLVAIPLFDMVFTSLRRIVRRGSPFAADRSHIHHLLLDLGFSHRRAVVLILAINLATTGLGLLLQRLEAPDYYQMGIIVASFIFYCLFASQAWRVADKLTAIQGSELLAAQRNTTEPNSDPHEKSSVALMHRK